MDSQRLTTIRSYAKNEFALTGRYLSEVNWPPATMIFQPVQRRRFRNTQIRAM